MADSDSLACPDPAWCVCRNDGYRSLSIGEIDRMWVNDSLTAAGKQQYAFLGQTPFVLQSQAKNQEVQTWRAHFRVDPRQDRILPLAAGSFGNVWLFQNDDNKTEVAVKIGHRKYDLEEDVEALVSLNRECSKYVVPTRIAHVPSTRELILIMPRAFSLQDVRLKMITGNNLPSRAIFVMRMMQKVCRALQCLLESNLCYLDLKPENTLFQCSENGNIRIFLGDVGSIDECDDPNIPLAMTYAPPHLPHLRRRVPPSLGGVNNDDPFVWKTQVMVWALLIMTMQLLEQNRQIHWRDYQDMQEDNVEMQAIERRFNLKGLFSVKSTDMTIVDLCRMFRAQEERLMSQFKRQAPLLPVGRIHREEKSLPKLSSLRIGEDADDPYGLFRRDQISEPGDARGSILISSPASQGAESSIPIMSAGSLTPLSVPGDDEVAWWAKDEPDQRPFSAESWSD